MAWADLLEVASHALAPEAWAYAQGAAGREQTAEADLDAFEEWRIVADPEADLAIARAAGSLGITSIVSCQASQPMEAIAAAGAGPFWFQLYWSSDDDLVASLVASLVERAEACGAEAIVVTLDTGMLGWRPRDLDRGFLPFVHGMGIAQYTSDPVFQRLVQQRMGHTVEGPRPRITPSAVRTLLGMARRYPGRLRDNLRSGAPRAAIETFLDVFARPALTWDHLPRLRELTRLPIVLKGIQHPRDARRAVDAGADAVYVSTHGGRQVDGGIGALAALPGVLEAVEGGVPVVLDSGVRTGADVVRALALGATAVGIGRPWVYGLAIAGEEGAREVLHNLLAETDLTLGLSGRAYVAELTPDILTRD